MRLHLNLSPKWNEYIKLIVGFCAIIAGAFMIAMAVHAAHEAAQEATGVWGSVSSFFKMVYHKVFGGEVEKLMAGYNTRTVTILIGGVILVILGALAVVFSSKKKRIF